jgi:RNA polymerase Rpc34 subunit
MNKHHFDISQKSEHPYPLSVCFLSSNAALCLSAICLLFISLFCLFLIYSSIYRGVWTRDIKLSTNIPQHTLTKTLKILEQRNLIKSVRSVVSKSKKLYMLYDIVPAKEITGNLI